MKTRRIESGHLQMAIDIVYQFKSEEAKVKFCDDNLVEEPRTGTLWNDSTNHKSQRCVKSPAGIRQEAIKSTLTPDEKLLIEVSVHQPIAESCS